MEVVRESKYLEVNISDNLHWESHISKTAAKASRTLGFVRGNLRVNLPKIKEQAYTALVRPQMEYASVVWDPHQRKDIDKLERVQRRVARYVTGRWHNTSSVTSMLQDLQWRSLMERRMARLTLV